MKIDYIYNQGSGIMNEDQFLIEDNLFAVFDGATSIDKYQDREGNTGGFLASRIAKEAFQSSPGSLKEKALDANRKIKEAMMKDDIDISDSVHTWSTGFAAAHISGETIFWSQITDCLPLVIFADNSFEVLVSDYDHDTEILSRWNDLKDLSQLDKRKELSEESKTLRRTQNIGYGVINGDPRVSNFIKSGELEKKNVKHIILFTDGLMPPKTDPRALDDFSQFVEIFLNKGLVGILSMVRDIENSDPECNEYPRYKKHDDIAAISISF